VVRNYRGSHTMRLQFLVALALVSIMVLVVATSAFATLSSLGYNIDIDYTVRDGITMPSVGLQPRPAYVATDGDNVLYVNAQYVQGNATYMRLYVTSISTTGTVNGEVGHCDVYGGDTSGAIAYKVVPVNRSVDPQLFAVLYGKANANKMTVGTFTVTSSGSVSGSLIDTYDLRNFRPDAGDGFYLTDGILLSYFVDGNNHYLDSVSVDAIGDIDDGGPIDSTSFASGGAYSFCIFPISSPDDYDSGGWWGSKSSANGTAQQLVLNTFFVDGSGNITRGDLNKQPTNLKARGDACGVPVNIRGSDYWLFGYSPAADDVDGYAATLQITSSGSISTTMTDSFEFQNSPVTYCSKFVSFYIGSSRYGILYANGAGVNRPNIVVFDLGTDGSIGLANKIGNEEYSASPWCSHGWGLYPIEGVNFKWATDWYLNNVQSTFTFGMYIPPTVDTTAVTSITETSAYCAAELTDEGQDYATAIGVCWSPFSGAPTVSGSHTTTNGTFSAGKTWNDLMDNMASGTKYYVRGYATNSAGTGYGDTLTFFTIVSYSNYLVQADFEADAITWTSSGIIEDQSLSGNDIYYDFGPMNSNLDVDVGGLVQTTSFYSPSSAEYNIPDVFEPVAQSEEMYQEGQGENLPVFELVEDAAEGMEWSTGILYSFIMIVSAMALGVGITIATGSVLLGVAGTAMLMFAAVSTGVLALWMALVYLFFAVGFLVVSRAM